MKNLKFIFLAFFLILVAAACESFSDLQASSPECSIVVKNALDATNQVCNGTGRNQACYGHVQVRAEPQPGLDTFQFNQVGAKVDVAALKTLHLSPMDTDAGTWGVALMNLQANLPDTSPGENVTLLLFGDVQIRNIVPAPRLLNGVTASGGNVNIRREPADDAFVLGTLPPSTAVVARARSEDGNWVYIDLPNNSGRGWISSSLVNTDGSIASLNPIKPFLADAQPMQAFYLRTGDNASTCAETPNDGLVIQTPEGEAEVRLWINEVKIRLKSTIFVEARRDKPMSITTLEGEVHVEAMGVEQAVPVGSSVSVQLNENQAPVAPPSAPRRVPKEVMPTVMPIAPTPLKTTVPVAPTIATDTPIPPTLAASDTATSIPTATATDAPASTPDTTELPTVPPTVLPTDIPTNVPVPTDEPASAATEAPVSTEPPAVTPASSTPQGGNGFQGQLTPTTVPPSSTPSSGSGSQDQSTATAAPPNDTAESTPPL